MTLIDPAILKARLVAESNRLMARALAAGVGTPAYTHYLAKNNGIITAIAHLTALTMAAEQDQAVSL